MKLRNHVFALAPLLMLQGCVDMGMGGVFDRYREDFHYNFALNPGATVELENSNGSVEITGWDKDAIDIDGTKFASSEERLGEVRIDISNSPGSISIRTVTPKDWRGNAGARYVIHVPRKVVLRDIRSSNGHIRVDSIDGETQLKTSNGKIEASRIHGRLEARSSNGALEIADITGDTILHTSNGSIRAEVRKGSFQATTSNGRITVRLMESDSQPVRLESSNGRIELTMDATREVHAETSNSSITVHMPASAGAEVRAHTTHSSISSDFDVSAHGKLARQHLEGTIGSGGPVLDLSTTNGAIRIARL